MIAALKWLNYLYLLSYNCFSFLINYKMYEYVPTKTYLHEKITFTPIFKAPAQNLKSIISFLTILLSVNVFFHYWGVLFLTSQQYYPDPRILRVPIWKTQFYNGASQNLDFGVPKICVFKRVILIRLVKFIVSSIYKVSVHLWYPTQSTDNSNVTS